jgi:thiol-disulfide isomerase/thioredoxin
MHARLAPVIIASLLFVTQSVRANPPVIEARAREVFQAMAEFYSGLERVRATVRLEANLPLPTAGVPYEFAAARPNRLLLRMPPGGQGKSMASNGTELTMLQEMDGGKHEWGVEPAPDSLISLLDHPYLPLTPGLGMDLQFIIPLLAGTAMEQILNEDGVRHVTYVGIQHAGDAEVHRLQFHFQQVPGAEMLVLDMWISAGEHPWLTRFGGKIPLPTMPVPDWPRHLEFSIYMTDWSAGEQAELLYALDIPPGARRLGTEPGEQDEKPHATIGQAAPAIELPLLGGERLVRAAGPSDDIILLDFWASWCIPCMRSLPKVAAFAERVGDKGVRFYAINLGEPAERASRAAKRRGFEFPIALDEDRAVARALGVAAIPHILIIDRDGVIRAVYVGANEDLVERLEHDTAPLLRER